LVLAIIAKLRKRFRKTPSRPQRPDADGVTYRPLRSLDERIEGWRVVIEDDRQRAMYDRVAASIDRTAYAALQDKYRAEIEAAEELAVTKYLDLAPWFMIHSRLARMLDIDTRPKCSILDIGAGGGQFLAIAKAYGHEVLAFDKPDPAVYGDLLKLCGIPRIEGSVQLGEPLPQSIGRFDLIMINGQVFDVFPKSGGKRWTVSEWASFLEYLTATHLEYPSTLFVGLNKSAGPTGVEEFLWPLVDLAEEHGATVERKRATMHYELTEPLNFEGASKDPWLTLGKA
jgi:SAM-dependent methyltransferase